MAWMCDSKHLTERRRGCLGIFEVDLDCPNKYRKHSNYGENLPQSTVLPGDTLHIGQVNLPLSIYPRHVGVVSGQPTARRLVQRISLHAL